MKKQKQQEPQRYVIRKFVMADSASAALSLEKSTPVRDVYVDDEWKKDGHKQLPDAVGFKIESDEEE